MESDQIIVFNLQKDLRYIKKLGSGGCGETYLFKDDALDIFFAIKKFAPVEGNDCEETFSRFVDEIKILYKILHVNIVRIFHACIYPAQKLGYIQMEYIEGLPIDQYIPDINSKSWEDIFKETISAFLYLHKHNILHRDIRYNNIMIDKNNNVKIIDFGFSKILPLNKCSCNSVILNWPVSENPLEIQDTGTYTVQSDIYFLGKLFYGILREQHEIEDFKYKLILDRMICIDPKERYQTFRDIELDFSDQIISWKNFNHAQKEIYQNFMSALENTLTHYYQGYKILSDINKIHIQLRDILKSSMLEFELLDTPKLINIFINGKYAYYNNRKIKIEVIREFYLFFTELESPLQKIVIQHIRERLGRIKVISEDDDIPF